MDSAGVRFTGSGFISPSGRDALNKMAAEIESLGEISGDGVVDVARAAGGTTFGVDATALSLRLGRGLASLLATPVAAYTYGPSLVMQPCDAAGRAMSFPALSVYAMPDRVSSAAPLTTSAVVMIVRAADGYWHLHSPAAAGHIEARIVSSSAAGANRWTYEFVQVVKTSAGYGGWSDVPGGLEGVAYNRNEDNNTGLPGSVLGNGVAVNSLTTASAEFTLRPIPDDTLVELRPLTLADGTVEYWMEIPNGIDGGCLNVS